MDLFSILVGAICGAIAGAVGVLAGKAMKTKKMQQIVTVVVMAGLFSVLFGIARSTIIADRREAAQMSAYETEVENNPAFQAVEEYAPEEMLKINAYLEQAVRESHSAATVGNNTRRMLTVIVGARMSRASDTAVLNSVNLTVDQIDWLYGRGDDTCFRLLHPDVAGGIGAESVFSDELLQRDFDSTRMILATYDAGRTVPDPTVAAELFNPVYLQLFERHGEEALIAFADVASPETDRRLVCRMTNELLRGVLALPEQEALTVLRWMFDSAAAQM